MKSVYIHNVVVNKVLEIALTWFTINNKLSHVAKQRKQINKETNHTGMM